MSTETYCAVCEQDRTEVPTMILARWRDQDVCLDCLAAKEEMDAEDAAEEAALTAVRSNTMPNTNCLAGLACPQCHSPGPFRIAVTTTVLVDDDGFYPEPQDIRAMEWDSGSYCKCVECDCEETVLDFMTMAEEEPA